MIGDMFNNELKAKVAVICSDVAELVNSHKDQWHAPLGTQSQVQGERNHKSAMPTGNWWPEALGHASSTGSQNDLHYAFFPGSRRLAVKDGPDVVLYDTKDYRIHGVSQQQSTGQSLRFNSQHGPVDISDLDEVTKSD